MIVALGVLGAVAYLVGPRIVASINADNARANLAAAVADFNRLRVPTDFVPVSRIGLGVPCLSTRCYRVAKPTTQIALSLRGLLRGIGAAYEAKVSACSTYHSQFLPPNAAPLETCEIVAKIHGDEMSVVLRP